MGRMIRMRGMEWPFDRFDELTTGKLRVYATYYALRASKVETLRGGGADSRNSGTQAACLWGGMHYLVHVYASVVLILIGNAFASFILCYSSHSVNSVKKILEN